MSDPARLSFVLERFRVAEAISADVTGRHGEMVRRDEDPVETFFNNVAGAQIVAIERRELFGTERSQYRLRVRDLEEVLDVALDDPEIPTATFTDTVRGIEATFLVAEVGYDFTKQQAQLVIWG